MIPMILMKGTVLIRISLVLEAWEEESPLVAAAAQAMGNHRQGRRLLLGALPQAEMLPARLFRGGRPVSITTASQRPIAQTTNTKNIAVKQENRQSYTFNVSDRNAASKLQSEVHSQSGQSTDDLARALKYGR